MKKIQDIAQKIGFWQTLDVLKNEPLPMKEFYARLRRNKNSYYNAFYRVKDFMIQHDVIYVNDGTISLSFIGLTILRYLREINKLLETIDLNKP